MGEPRHLPVRAHAGGRARRACRPPDPRHGRVPRRRKADAWALWRTVGGLGATRLLVLSSDDRSAPATDSLVAALRAAGNAHVTSGQVATDHSWPDRRIALETAVVARLQAPVQ